MKTSEQHKGRLFVVVSFSSISDVFRHYLRLLKGMVTTNIEQLI